MAVTSVFDAFIKEIADAIRYAESSTSSIDVDDFEVRIKALKPSTSSSGGSSDSGGTSSGDSGGTSTTNDFDTIYIGNAEGTVGTMSQPMCLITVDDGGSNDTAVIDEIVKGLGVPITFAPQSTSASLVTTNINALKEAINDYGCAVAIHGGSNWDATAYTTESAMNSYFDTFISGMNDLGIEVHGGTQPNGKYYSGYHDIFKSKINCCFTGDTQDTSNRYYNGVNKPTSDLWNLERWSPYSGLITNIINSCINNNGFLGLYFHSGEWINGTTSWGTLSGEECKSKVISAINTLKNAGVKFITTRNIYHVNEEDSSGGTSGGTDDSGGTTDERTEFTAYYNIPSWMYTNLTLVDNQYTGITKGSSFSDTIKIKSGHSNTEIASESVTMGGENITLTLGSFSIPSVTDDIYINITSK